MPQVVEIEGVGQVHFPDEMTLDQIQTALDTEILPQVQQPKREPLFAPAPPPATTDSLFSRFGASVAENTTLAAQGVSRILEQTPGVDRLQQDLDFMGLGKYGPKAQGNVLREELRGVQANVRPSYGVGPAETFPEKLVEGAGSLPIVLATGPLAPLAYGGLMGENQRQDAERFTEDKLTQDVSFLSGAAIGATTEYLLGVPAFLRDAGGSRVLTMLAKGALREGTQEGLEQAAGNAVAQSLYDPNRKVSEGVGESILLGAILGAGMGPLLSRPSETPYVPLEPDAPQDLSRISSLLEETDTPLNAEQSGEPDLSKFGSQARVPEPIVTPTQQAAATVLGEDPTELRQQEAIQTGQTIPITEEVSETPTEEAILPSQEPVEDVLLPEEGQDTTPDAPGLSTLDSDTFQTLSDEPLREGWVGYQDPETLQAFQVPEGSTPEVVQARLQEVRAEESDAYRQAREDQLEQELVQQRFDENAKAILAQQDEAPLMRKNLLTGDPAKELWMDQDRLKFVLERQEANLKRAEAGTLREAGGTEKVDPETLRPGVQALRDRLAELEGTIQPAREAAKKMKRPKKGEEGSTEIPQAILDAGRSLYRKGIEFKDWSAAMVKNLGENVRPVLRQIWESVQAAVNLVSPAARPRSSSMQARPAPEAGSLGDTGGRRPPSLPGQPPPLPTPKPKWTAIFNDNVDAARKEMGLPPAIEPLKRSFGAVWDEAMAILEKNPKAGSDLVASLVLDPRPVTDVQDALLAHERAVRDNDFQMAVENVNTASTEAEVMDGQAKLQQARDANQILFDVTKAVGTETARGLSARKMLVNPDFTLARIEAETRAIENNGKPLSPKQLEDVKKLYDELEAARKEIARLEELQSKETAAGLFKALIADIKTDRKAAVKEGKSLTEFLNDQADKARERLRDKLNRSNTFVDPTIIVDLSIIGASHIANGISTIAEFTAQMVADFGPDVEAVMPQVFEQAQAFHDGNKGAFEKPSEPTSQQILAGATATLDPKLVFNLARAYVREGVEGAENVIERVHADLVKLNPELTLREVRDAFSGYGKVTYPSKEEELVKLRQYKELSRLLSQLEDVKKRQAPLKTGPQRDKMTLEARVLQKEINDLMRRYGIKQTSPEQQLKTSIDAVKTRLKNEIEELDRAIQTRTPRPNNRGVIEYDEEAKALLAERDRRKAQYAALFPKKGRTPEETVKATLAALDQSIAEETKLLQDGILKRPSKAPGVSTPEIDNKRMELDALRQLRRDLYEATQPRKSSEDLALEAALKSTKASIERMDQMLKSGNLDPAVRAQRFTPTAELEALWSERDAMRDVLAELRRDQKPRTDPQERARKQAVKALEKSIAKLDQRLLSNDFSAAPQRASRPDTQEIAKLREIRDTMRQTFNELKKAQTPVRSADEIRLQRDKKLLENRIEKLHQRILTGNYAPAVKPDPVTDQKKKNLEAEYAILKQEYLKGLFEAQLRNRSLTGKVLGGIGETLNTSRAILTSADVSAVLRQGGFIAFGNPVRAAQSFGPMFKSFASERESVKIMQEIQNRPNAPLYRQAKLYLAEDAPNSLSKMEEAYASRWINKIPTALGGGLVRGSQRAYTTFLNKLRADSFDAMAATLAHGGKPTLEESRALANFINVATGRGSLGKFESGGQILNTTFFAPRYVASRFQLLMGQPFYGGNARTRKLIAKEYGKYLIGVGVALSLLMGLQDKDDPVLELDPRSSDFLKVRFGNTRIDLLSGLLQTTVFIARVGTAGVLTADGKVKSTQGATKFGQPDTWDTMTKFLRTKMAPVPGAFVDWRAGKNVVGQPVTGKQVVGRMLVPISMSEIAETMQEQGIPRGTAFMLLSLLGAGVQTYQPKPKKAKPSKDSQLTSTKF